MELEEIRSMLATMSDKKLVEFFDGVAERGAVRALRKVGLDDEFAFEDIKAIRNSWKAWISLRKLAWKGFWAQIGRAIGIVLTLGVLWLVLGDPEKVKRVASMVVH